MKKKYKGLCVIDSVYTFFLFVLVNIKDYKEFFYVFWVNMPLGITEKLPNKLLLYDSYVAISDPNNFVENWRYKLRFYWIMTKFKLWGVPACGQDHLPFSRYILNYTNKSFEEYEDGLANYYHQDDIKKYKILRKICAADSEPIVGYSGKVKRIYLTDESLPISPKIAYKVVYIDVKKEWELLSMEKKMEIMELFDMSNVKIDKNVDTIVLTRPYSEDNMCTEEEKINKLRVIFKGNVTSRVAIKPHCRELTDYKKAFPNVNVIERRFPIELYLLINSKRIKRFVTYGECSAEHFIRKYYPQIEYIREE